MGAGGVLLSQARCCGRGGRRATSFFGWRHPRPRWQAGGVDRSRPCGVAARQPLMLTVRRRPVAGAAGGRTRGRERRGG